MPDCGGNSAPPACEMRADGLDAEGGAQERKQRGDKAAEHDRGPHHCETDWRDNSIFHGFNLGARILLHPEPANIAESSLYLRPKLGKRNRIPRASPQFRRPGRVRTIMLAANSYFCRFLLSRAVAGDPAFEKDIPADSGVARPHYPAFNASLVTGVSAILGLRAFA